MNPTLFPTIRTMWTSGLEQRFLLCYAVFLWMPLVIPSNALVCFWFYGMVFGLGVWTWWHRPHPRHRTVDWHNPLVLLFVTLHLFTLAHTLILDDDPLRIMRHTIINGAFLTATYAVCSSFLLPNHTSLGRAQKHILVTVLCMAVLSLLWFLVLEEWWMQPIAQRSSPPRLEPVGNFTHPILGANVYCVWALTGLIWWHPTMQGRRQERVLACITWVVTLIMVLHTQSRGPLLSYLMTSLIALYVIGYRRSFLVISLCGGMIIGDCVHYLMTHQAWLPLEELYARIHILITRDSHRGEIWRLAWQMILERPLLGYGLSASFPYGYGGVNPHNLFLSSWYYTGIVGCALLLSITATALYQAWSMRHHPLAMISFILIIHAIMACFTDQGQFVKTPSALWMIYWLPIGVVAGLWTQKRKGTMQYSTLTF
jgi:O-antigen ligase